MIPEKPEALLWVDVETTGLDANMCSMGCAARAWTPCTNTGGSRPWCTSAGRPC